MLLRPTRSGFALPFLLGATVVLCCCLSDVQGSTKSFRSRQASELVAEALRAEVYGLAGEREKLLEQALKLIPDFGPAMWHRGFVQVDGRWVNVDEIGQQPNSNRALQSYEQLRNQTPANAAGHMHLADWCRQAGLRLQERAHLSQVLDMDPGNTAAMARLGFRKINGRWLSAEEIEQSIRETKQASADLAQWRPEITAIRQGLRHRSLARRQAASERLSRIDSAAAVPALEALLANDSPQAAEQALAAFGRIADYRAALAIARMAVHSPWPAVRQQAAGRLKSRDDEQFVPAMLGAMHSPVTSRTLATRDARGRLDFVQTLQREAQHENEQLVLSARNSHGVSEGDVRLLNIHTGRLNQRIAAALNIATGQDLPASPQQWWNWWNEKNEVFVQGEKSTRVVGDYNRPIPLPAGANRSSTSTQSATQVASVDNSRELRDLQRLRREAELRERARRQQSLANRPQRRSDCLIAGTLIWTISGPRPVEQIRPGDLVLSQDVQTGQLDFKPVLRTTVRPTTTLVRIDAVGQQIEASGGHPFWVSGEGWVKARELTAGMELRTVDGTVCVRRVEDGQRVQSFNLIVADFHSYFAGQAKVLSHDNTVRRVTNATVPGLAE